MHAFSVYKAEPDSVQTKSLPTPTTYLKHSATEEALQVQARYTEHFTQPLGIHSSRALSQKQIF